MEYIAIMKSGNYAYRLQGILAKKGISTDVINTPCKISKFGCSYSIKFNAKYRGAVTAASNEYGLPIYEMFEIQPEFMKNTYKKL